MAALCVDDGMFPARVGEKFRTMLSERREGPDCGGVIAALQEIAQALTQDADRWTVSR